MWSICYTSLCEWPVTIDTVVTQWQCGVTSRHFSRLFATRYDEKYSGLFQQNFSNQEKVVQHYLESEWTETWDSQLHYCQSSCYEELPDQSQTRMERLLNCPKFRGKFYHLDERQRARKELESHGGYSTLEGMETLTSPLCLESWTQKTPQEGGAGTFHSERERQREGFAYCLQSCLLQHFVICMIWIFICMLKEFICRFVCNQDVSECELLHDLLVKQEVESWLFHCGWLITPGYVLTVVFPAYLFHCGTCISFLFDRCLKHTEYVLIY